MSKDKAVIVGGAGFLGSHVADYLSDNGFDVIIYDQNESRWLRDDQTMVIGDILDINKMREVFKGARYVYHFAGIADIDESREKPYETIQTNVMGSTAVVQAAYESNIERFILASTMYVYSPHGSFYRASKQAVETLIEAYSDELGMDYTFLRFGSLYGPRSQPWNGFNKYVSEIVNNKKLVYRGSGQEVREYIHVQDAARLSVKILDDQHKNMAITVTGHQILTSSKLIDMIFEITGLEKNVEYLNSAENTGHYKLTPYRFTPKKAKKLVPDEFVDIGQGILDTIEEMASKNI